jgi:light-regulated signal transduction histidine kinase (bacteriophytochrome)
MKKILIIEDNISLNEELIDWFTFEGFEAWSADNGLKGIEMAIQLLPDIILCDIMMPDMIGTEVIGNLRKNNTTRLIPFIFMTALSGRVNIRTGMELGADDYITKPFTRLELIKTVNTRLKKAENISEHTDTKAQERTAQLDFTNRELEAFSYSVSHDLHTPLRALNGYASMLIEDYSELLDSEGKRMLNAIVDQSNKMGCLIDDLLSFSRINMNEIKISAIDMHSLAINVYDELTTDTEKEKIDFRISEIDSINGDTSMLKQIWVNLISNAIKYTSKISNPVIEIGSTSDETETVYYIKDNGAGFDMEYYDKLFGVFKRLHSTRQFEGNGVGLAIVHRIVQRHQGRVWAESEINKGATFYFALPAANASNGIEH